jgi:hypothetical protein
MQVGTTKFRQKASGRLKKNKIKKINIVRNNNTKASNVPYLGEAQNLLQSTKSLPIGLATGGH